jgi:hypothetical protein
MQPSLAFKKKGLPCIAIASFILIFKSKLQEKKNYINKNEGKIYNYSMLILSKQKTQYSDESQFLNQKCHQNKFETNPL